MNTTRHLGTDTQETSSPASALAIALELGCLAAWAAWVGRDLLDLNPFVWPAGNEFGTQIVSLHFWTDFTKCGLCALWNGWVNGGWPALADPFGSSLHPISAVSTLLFGVVNGAKLTVIASMWIAGLAQWWIAHSLHLGRIPRLWSSAIAIAGGHLVGKMELGAVGLVLSIATGSLVVAGILDLWLNGHPRSTPFLALAGAAAIVSGHGYIQFSILLWSIPTLLLAPKRKGAWNQYFIALVLALLISSVFLVPWLHFWPQAAKYVDTGFQAAQPFAFAFSNLVIHDWSFYFSTALDKWPYPYLYNLFIGWIPVGLAALALPLARVRDRRAIVFLIAGGLWLFWFASATPMRLMARWVPSIGDLRHTPIFAALAVPAFLGCSAYALDRLLRFRPPPSLRPTGREWQELGRLSVACVVAVVLLLSLKQVADFAIYPLATVDRSVGIGLLRPLRIDENQWTAFPFGEHLWTEMGVSLGFKVTGLATPWWWDQRPAPDPFLEITRHTSSLPGAVAGNIRGIPIYVHPDNQYASVVSIGQASSCQAQGIGGYITVECDNPKPGLLLVRENSWTGWRASMDGSPIPLKNDRWLTVDAPAGTHIYTFRYLPWDAVAGAFLSCFGWLGLWRLFSKARVKSRPRHSPLSALNNSM